MDKVIPLECYVFGVLDGLHNVFTAFAYTGIRKALDEEENHLSYNRGWYDGQEDGG